MGTPFSKYSNLKILVEVPTGIFERNSETGNEEEVFKKVIYKASVQVDVDSSRANLGIDNKAIYIEGNLTEPKLLPSHIRPNDRFEAFIIDPATGNEIPGEFVFDLIIQPRFKAVSKVLGSEVKGWFSSYG